MFTWDRAREMLLGALIVLSILYLVPGLLNQVPLTAVILILVIVLLWICTKTGSSNLAIVVGVIGLLVILLGLIPGTQFTLPFVNWNF